jgi:hypothetical protein
LLSFACQVGIACLHFSGFVQRDDGAASFDYLLAAAAVIESHPACACCCRLVCAALQRVLGLCLALLESAGSRPKAQQQLFVEHFVLLVAAAPGLAAAAPAAIQVRPAAV